MSISISQVKGIGPSTEEALADAGITSVESLVAYTLQQLTTLPGFGEIRAGKVIEHARQLLADASISENESDTESSSVEKNAAKENKENRLEKKAGKKGKKAKKKKEKEKKIKEKGKKSKSVKKKDKKKAKKKGSK